VRSRGQARAWVGDFEGARRDYQTALEQSISVGDRVTEWQALVDLGLLWLGRDFSRGRGYCERALEVATKIGDRSSFARSLNLLGQCAMWTGQPFEAQRFHQQALAHFREVSDDRGEAETLELLGTAAALGCDLVGADNCLRQALERYRDLDDRRGVVVCLMRLTGSGPALNTDFLVPARTSLDECIASGEQAVELAREIGWRAREAEALGWLSLCLGARGEYGRALARARACIALADDIGHQEALLHGHGAMGQALQGLLALPVAIDHLERAVTLARELRSPHYIATLGGMLAAAYVEAGQLGRAESLLDATLGDSITIETFGQRSAWWARAQLALARGEPERALELVDWLIRSDPNSGPEPERTIVRLELLRGQTQIRVGRLEQAEATLRKASDVARVQGARPLLWRSQALLGGLYRRQGRRADAECAFSTARSIVEELTADLQEAELRNSFLYQVDRLLPRRPMPTPRRSARQAYGGLTEREREVAGLIAQGKTNRAIADQLVISKRTVDAHVSTILSKLGARSRRQIATWAAEQGLVLAIWNAGAAAWLALQAVIEAVPAAA
jgi:DNA-binding CsgD family transcriptional regulator